MSNRNLTRAKRAKNDEFYTLYQDIEAEMNAYLMADPDVFRDKTVLCPCDDPEWSNFTRYFTANFRRLGLKRLVCTSYAKSAGSRQLTLFEESSPAYDPDRHDTHGKLFTKTRGGGEDVTLQGYLEGDGDFRSPEVTRLRDEADVIVTNPPFSLFREFLAWVMDGGKRFSVIGNMNAITYKEVFPLLKENRIWMGASLFHGGATYFIAPQDLYNPDMMSNPKNAYLKDGKFYWRVNGVRWFTNLDHVGRHEPLALDTMAGNLRYNRKLRKTLIDKYGQTPDTLHYPQYDNYDAIEVPYVECIPGDYTGVMGVPISFLDKYDPDQFEIVSFRKGDDGHDLVFTTEREKEYNRTFASLCDVDSGDDQERRRRNQWQAYLRAHHHTPHCTPVDLFHPLSTNLANGLVNDCTVAGRKTYVRMLIRPRKS